jgi:hypothetical protein
LGNGLAEFELLRSFLPTRWWRVLRQEKGLSQGSLGEARIKKCVIIAWNLAMKVCFACFEAGREWRVLFITQ